MNLSEEEILLHSTDSFNCFVSLEMAIAAAKGRLIAVIGDEVFATDFVFDS